jgi:hypothetical protein
VNFAVERLRIPPIHHDPLHILIHLEIDNIGRLSTKLYDKRDDFKFPIVNFPFLCGNIPAAPAYGVYISQLVRYSRACGVYRDFLDRAWLLTDTLMRQAYVAKRLKSSLLNLFGRHHDLVDVMRQLFHRCKHMCFLDQLRSSSAPDLTLAITAGVPKEAVDAYSAGTPDLTLVFMGL